MARSCPWCCEPIPRAHVDQTCPHCGRELASDGGRELRDIDVRYDQVEADQRHRLKTFLIYGSTTVALLSFVMPLLHMLSVLMVPVLVAGHLISVRLVLIADARRLLGPRRRIFTRWVVRLAFVWLGLPGYGLAITPLVGPLFAVITFVGLTMIAYGYSRWSLDQEHRRQPLMIWEMVVLASLAAITLGFLLTLLVGGALLGWSVARLIELLAGNGG